MINETGTTFYKPREFFTITELCSFARCPRRYFYSAGCGFRKAQAGLSLRDNAAHFGTALGAALPEVCASGDVVKAFGIFQSIWGDSQGDDKRNPITAGNLLSHFSVTHGPNKGIYRIKEPPASPIERREDKSRWEVPFAIDIPGLPLPLIGSIDYIANDVTYPSDEWVIEAKTSSEMSDRMFASFKRSPQGLAYTLARRVSNPRCKGYVMEILGTAKNPKIPVMTIPMQVSDMDLEDFIIWARMTGLNILACEEQMKGRENDSTAWPKDMSGCAPYPQHYSPGYFCEFDPLCSVPDYRQMTQFYDVKRHLPYVLPTVEGKKIFVGLDETNVVSE